ncbi:Fatty acyl-CoA reductase 1 [Holothuria leucospilota]|uniref:Fatty acyl-CoA reductase n=1 Tax=Holothuria leucospilota TaxID=206669 RepID=A0A9Q1BG80_HOLLE|nr:Fatty acyl-CoA reductase 1 [Holothuria leucospilota]
MNSPVADYFAGKTIMLTGGTGFIGKVLVEKILRCCPDVDKFYLLIRPKAGQDPQQRIKKEFVECKRIKGSSTVVVAERDIERYPNTSSRDTIESRRYSAVRLLTESYEASH